MWQLFLAVIRDKKSPPEAGWSDQHKAPVQLAFGNSDIQIVVIGLRLGIGGRKLGNRLGVFIFKFALIAFELPLGFFCALVDRRKQVM